MLMPPAPLEGLIHAGTAGPDADVAHDWRGYLFDAPGLSHQVGDPPILWLGQGCQRLVEQRFDPLEADESR
ncbi:hypothetical protein, partial [Nocardia africana]|uniref:hypothetical protein n=1 Tax=Nocardia africana TaxID=134964 RepID=UPI001C3FBE3A